MPLLCILRDPGFTLSKALSLARACCQLPTSTAMRRPVSPWRCTAAPRGRRSTVLGLGSGSGEGRAAHCMFAGLGFVDLFLRMLKRFATKQLESSFAWSGPSTATLPAIPSLSSCLRTAVAIKLGSRYRAAKQCRTK